MSKNPNLWIFIIYWIGFILPVSQSFNPLFFHQTSETISDYSPTLWLVGSVPGDLLDFWILTRFSILLYCSIVLSGSSYAAVPTFSQTFLRFLQFRFRLNTLCTFKRSWNFLIQPLIFWQWICKKQTLLLYLIHWFVISIKTTTSMIFLFHRFVISYVISLVCNCANWHS